MTKLGQEFEEAVYTFAKTLDSSAEVLFDHSVLDRDTGETRQCDVWINAKFGGHWPLSIIVSCKDRKKSGRKLHAGDIGTFRDEVRSTGASTGVIYCNTGFTAPAIKKAGANGIACCRLYQNEPADIPSSIWLEQFCCNTSVMLSLQTDVSETKFKTWNDLFTVSILIEETQSTLLDVIVEAAAKGENQAISEIKKTDLFSPNWTTELLFKINSIDQPLLIQVLGKWKRYRARLEATLLNGSYCLSDGSFQGKLVGPSVDTQSAHPGESWVKMTDKDFAPPTNLAVIVLSGGDVKTALQQGYGSKRHTG